MTNHLAILHPYRKLELFSGFSDLVFVKKKSKKTSWVKKPEPQVKDHYIHTCKTEAQALANRLQKPEGRLRQLIMVFTRIRKVNYYSSMCCFSVLLSPFKLMISNVMYSNLFASFAATCMVWNILLFEWTCTYTTKYKQLYLFFGIFYNFVFFSSFFSANRLFCPEYTKEPCACIQKYIKNQGNI